MSEPATTSARPAFPRHPRLRSFARKFGRAYVDLACHAAFPIALTPDLLYMLWGGFPRDVLDQPIGAPWVAVADLLLSSMCDEVGHELYELDPAVREELLAELRANPRFGPQRAAELSDFVARYVEQQLRSALLALASGSAADAERVLRGEYRVNAMEVGLDEECNRILATRGPTASDLRLVVAVLKAITRRLL